MTRSVPTSVRVPEWLYQQVVSVLLNRLERPSYGQLVIWALEDHPDEVAEELAGAAPSPQARIPRGRRVATARTALGLQLKPGERAMPDDLASRTSSVHSTRVTRADVAIAALTVAVRHGPQ